MSAAVPASPRRAADRVRRLAAALVVPVLLGAGCSAGGGPRPDPSPADPSPTPAASRPEWRPVPLPPPPGSPGRPAPRAAVACGDRWYVVGAVAGADGETRPAAWTSTDTRAWQSLRLTPKTYYGERNVLHTAACRGGRLVAVGGKNGGAHGNPRVSSWRELADGSLLEVTAPFELYGGPQAVNVGRLASGPSGLLIVGNRMTGAAVWTSSDATRFDIHEGVPELASDARGETWAADAVATPGGWLVVGGLVGAGRTDRDPLVWTSPDGRSWRRVGVPATTEYDELQRVTLSGDTPVAVGPYGRAFGAWRAAAGGWVAAGRFGVPAATGVPLVRSLAPVDGGAVVAAVSDGTRHGLWTSVDQGDGWRPVVAPAEMPAGADRDVAVAGGPGGLLLVIDDGRAGRLWFAAALPPPTA